MPTLADDAILVRVQAASLNAADLEYLHGRSMARLGGLSRPRLRGLFVDVAAGSKPSVDESRRCARATRSMAI